MDLCAEVDPARINYNVMNTNSDNLEINDMVYEFAAFNFLSEPLPLAFHNIKNFASSNKSSKKSTQFVFNGFKKAFMLKQSSEYFITKPLWLVANEIIIII